MLAGSSVFCFSQNEKSSAIMSQQYKKILDDAKLLITFQRESITEYQNIVTEINACLQKTKNSLEEMKKVILPGQKATATSRYATIETYQQQAEMNAVGLNDVLQKKEFNLLKFREYLKNLHGAVEKAEKEHLRLKGN